MMTRVGLTRRTALVFVGAGILVCTVRAVAQVNAVGGAGADALGAAFEVASIRPSAGSGGGGVEVEPSGRFKASGQSIESLFWTAYGDAYAGKSMVKVDRGTPKWVSSDLFDINATVDEAYKGGWDKLSEAQRMERVRPMLRRLLADRFQVKMRVEMRKTPVYALVQAKGGAHVKEVPAPAAWEGDRDKAVARWMADHPGKGAPGGWTCGGDKCVVNAAKINDAIVQIMFSSQADRMVVDETGLKGYYDFSFTFYVPQESGASPMQVVADDLGMRFEPRSVQMKTYVILSAEKPSVDGD